MCFFNLMSISNANARSNLKTEKLCTDMCNTIPHLVRDMFVFGY